jgi:poly(A) polymerase
MLEADLIRHVLPELQPIADDDRDGGSARHKDIWEHTLRVVERAPARLAVRWAALLHDAAKPMTRSVDEHGEVHFFGQEALGAELARKALRRKKPDLALEQRVRRLVAMHLRPAGYDDTWTDLAVRRPPRRGDVLRTRLIWRRRRDQREHRGRRRQWRVAGCAHHERLLAGAALTHFRVRSTATC